MNDPLDRLKAVLSDRYVLERELGQGGMTTVWRAHDLKHERDVAVKILRPELASSVGPERFLAEIHLTARLQHPNILTLIDSGEAGGLLYYVMPYVEGPTLRHRLLRERELPVGEVVRILRDVADALTEAHAHGVVHRDLKPENVMLSGRHAPVADFGVAKAVSEATGRHHLTTKGVAYEMLTGEPPFVRTTAQATLAAQVTEQPVAVTERRETVPPVRRPSAAIGSPGTAGPRRPTTCWAGSRTSSPWRRSAARRRSSGSSRRAMAWRPRARPCA